jgi:hypothetical protein
MTKHARGADPDRQRDKPLDDLGSPRRDLAAAVKDLLGSSLGADLPGSHLARMSAKVTGLIAASLYGCIPALQFALGSPKALIVLSCWGALYFGIVVALTRSTSPWVLETVETLILPTLSDAGARTALMKMRSDFKRPQLVVVSLMTALVFVGISWLFLRQYPPQHVALWCLGYFYLYFTAALVTLTTRFYTCFSTAIKQNPDQLFRLDPASSPVIFASRALANRMLRYWFCVFLLVVTLGIVIIPPFATRIQLENADAFPEFVLAVIAVAGFFSFVFGSLVYLQFESDLRNAVDRMRLTALVGLQREYAERFEVATAGELLSKGGLTRTAGRTLAATLVAILPAVAGILAAIGSLLSSSKKIAP